MAMKRDSMPKTIDAFTTRTHLGQVIKRVAEGERFIVTKKGKPQMVLMSIDDFEDLLEIAAERQDKELQRALKESARQYKRGEVSSLEALQTIYAGSE